MSSVRPPSPFYGLNVPLPYYARPDLAYEQIDKASVNNTRSGNFVVQDGELIICRYCLVNWRSDPATANAELILRGFDETGNQIWQALMGALLNGNHTPITQFGIDLPIASDSTQFIYQASMPTVPMFPRQSINIFITQAVGLEAVQSAALINVHVPLGPEEPAGGQAARPALIA